MQIHATSLPGVFLFDPGVFNDDRAASLLANDIGSRRAGLDVGYAIGTRSARRDPATGTYSSRGLAFKDLRHGGLPRRIRRQGRLHVRGPCRSPGHRWLNPSCRAILSVPGAMMTKRFPPLSINPDLTLNMRCAPCIHAAFQQAQDNPLIAIAATDKRGELIAVDCAVVRPWLVEVIHTRPHVARGNHRHRHCSEVLTVTSGVLDIYLLCDCPGKHLFYKRMERGASVHLPPGTAHAVHTLAETAITSIFIDGDPRGDREQVDLIHL